VVRGGGGVFGEGGPEWGVGDGCGSDELVKGADGYGIWGRAGGGGEVS